MLLTLAPLFLDSLKTGKLDTTEVEISFQRDEGKYLTW